MINLKNKLKQVSAMAFAIASVVSLAGTTFSTNVYAQTKAFADYTVQGVSPSGTTINLFDYWLDGQDRRDDSNPNNYQNLGINNDHVLKFGAGMGQDENVDPNQMAQTANSSNVNHWTSSASPRQGIVTKTLVNGYPQLNSSVGSEESLSYLFDNSTFEGKQAYSDVKGLLQVDQDGYYYYNSQLNFAEFDENSNTFNLYDTWGVKKAGSSPDGQFFPFNKADEVFDEGRNELIQKDIKSTNEVINHYFGMTMSTRFIQQYGGHTDETKSKPVTYNFSGDDDVWIYIDNVLVGDLGGIHNASSLEINFESGKVYIYGDKDNDNEYDRSDVLYSETTLSDLFEDAGVDNVSFNGNTFADNTYHTLNFFYLERGNTDSNMSLKYNLVTMPETDIVKVDENGKGVAGVTFTLIPADSNYQPTNENRYSATTGNDGSVVFINPDNQNLPLQLEDLKAISEYWILRETGTPDGYRSIKDSHLYFMDGQDPILLSDSIWDNGTYAQPKVLSQAKNELTLDDGSKVSSSQGRIYAVPEKKIDNEWKPLVGENLTGWQAVNSIEESIRQNNYVFVLGSSGSYECVIDEIPGDVTKYEFFVHDAATYRMAYYMNINGEYRQITDGIDRDFSARLYVSNVSNSISIRKTDTDGKALENAEFGLYSEDQVNEGKLIENAQASQSAKTNANGIITFNKLTKGTYYIAETAAPKNYSINTTLTKVIVNDHGVYADAGDEEDGVSVTRGVGTILKSVSQFATSDVIGSTLHDIVATKQTSDVGPDQWMDTKEKLHLQYGNEGKIFEYGPTEQGGAVSFTVESGWSNVKVEQCSEFGYDNKENLSGKDLTSLFTGSVLVTYEDQKEGVLDGETNLKGTKVLTGRDWKENESFTFELKTEDETTINALKEEKIVKLDENTETPVAVEEDATSVIVDTTTLENNAYKADEEVSFNFGDLKFKAEGEYVFTIAEKIPADPDTTLTYSKAEYKVTVTVNSQEVKAEMVQIKDETGKDQEAAVIEQAKFTNAYAPTSITLDGDKALKVTKEVIGAPALSEFEFELELTSDNADGVTGLNENKQLVAATTGLTKEDPANSETVTFAPLTFTKAGTYTFSVTETTTLPEGANGWTYDNTSKTITVTITDEAGKLVASTEIIDEETGESVDTNNPTITNEYVPGSITIGTDGQAGINVQKTLAGREWKETDSFEFTITAVTENAPLPEKNTILVSGQTGTTDPVTQAFGSIEYTKEDLAGAMTKDFEYTITETSVDANGVKSDPATTRKVIVRVTDDASGQLSAEIIYNNENASSDTDKTVRTAAAFTNTYSPTSQVLDGKTNLSITKKFTGKEWNEETFTFTLNPVTDYGDKIIMPETTLTLTKDNQTGNFGDITFKEAGEYEFVIKEEIPQESGNISYDGHKYRIKVTVTDNQDGTLTVSPSVVGEGSNTFTNTYTPTQATATIQINKAISGRDMNETDDGAYTFTMEAVDGAPLPQVTTATNDQDGKVTFMPISYSGTQDASYEYVIKETGNENEANSVETSTEEIHVTVDFTYDGSTGQLKPAVTYRGADGENDSTITNVYRAKPVTIEAGITGTKTVSPSTGNAYTMQGNEFSFKIVPDQNNPKSDPITEQTVANDASGNIVFAKAPVYTEAGTYNYTVSETNTSVGGIQIDPSIYTISITIQDPGDGQLTQSVAITKEGTPVNAITFDNGYDPASTSAKITATKNLVGKDLEDGEFAFLLKEVSRTYTVTEEVEGTEDTETTEVMEASTYEETVRNTGNMIDFTTIDYDRPGTYVYEISEINEGKLGITYDGNVYTVTVNVTDENGILKASIVNGEGIVFNNSYTPTPVMLNGDTAIKANKMLDGKDLIGDDFTFVLKDEAGNVVMETTNKVDGTIVFEGIQFTEEGTYYYTVSEKNTSKTGITYDGTTYVVAIKVQDMGGYLDVVDMGYYKDNAKVEAIVFNNSYQPMVTAVQFYPTKMLEGRELKDKEFTFVLKDEAGNVISEATNDVSGLIVFDKIEFTQAGTYVFTASEVAGEDETITYDGTVYTYTVVVEDKEGRLEPTTTCDGDQVFRNKYEKPEEEKPEEQTPGSEDKEDPEKGDTSNTSTQTYAGLFTGMMAVAASLMAILFVWRKRMN